MPSPLDAVWVPRYGSPTFAVKVRRAGVPASADDAVDVSLYAYDDQFQALASPVWTRTAVERSTGDYEASLSSVDTEDVGAYRLRFSWRVDGSDEAYSYDVEVGQSSPAYDGLTSAWRSVVEGVWWKFSDLFDSPYGGPNLQTYVQTHFSRNRLAMMLSDAVSTLNTATMGHASWSVNDDSFPFGDWMGLLQDSLYVEVLKHLVRSYVEQPEVILGTSISRVDRRDYMNRWQAVLDSEVRDLQRDLGRFKMSQIGLGSTRVLVAGGAYGNYGPTMEAGGSGEAAARGYFSVVRSY